MTAPAAAPVRPSPVRYLVLVGAVMIQLILGTVYGYSIFWAPLQAAVYPPILTQAEADARVAAGEAVTDFTVVADAAAARVLKDQRQGYLKYAFSICILSFALVMVVAGRVQDVLGPRIPALIGGVLMALGFFLAGVMNHRVVLLVCHAGLCALVALLLISISTLFRKRLDPHGAENGLSVSLAVAVLVTVAGVLVGEQYVGRLAEFDKVALLWGTIGFLAGAGIGFAYVCPIAALVKWFPTAKGLVSGIAVAGFGFGALDDAGKGVIGQVGGETSQGASSALCHEAGDGVWLVAELVDGSQHPGAGFRADPLIVVDHARNGLVRDPSLAGDITDGDMGALGHGILVKRGSGGSCYRSRDR